jgi:hypothetical protein
MGVHIDALIDDMGFESASEYGDGWMMEAVGFESIVPGVCKDEDCLAVMDVELDQDKGWCCVCHENTVVSCLRLWGVI